MVPLTQQERKVVTFVVLTIVVGVFLDFTFKGRAHKIAVLNILDDTSFYPRLNINTASVEDLAAVPRMSPALAVQIVHYRQKHGLFPDIQALTRVPGIRPSQLKRLMFYLKAK
jgi:competence ComEA-like helix-hairpin-helix protein